MKSSFLFMIICLNVFFFPLSNLWTIQSYWKYIFLKVRYLNMYNEGDLTHYGQVLEHCNIRKCWEECKSRSDFFRRKREIEIFNRYLELLTLWDKFEDTKGVIRSCKSKNRQHSHQKKKDKRTNNDLQNTTHTTKDWATRTLLRAGYELRCSGRVNSSCSTSDTCHVTIKGNDHHLTCDAAFKHEVDSYQVSSISAIYIYIYI